MVYLLLHKSGKRFKIGLSLNPKERVKNLPEAAEIDMDRSLQFVLPSRKHAYVLESAMHTILSDYRIQPDQLRSGRFHDPAFHDRGFHDCGHGLAERDDCRHSRHPNHPSHPNHPTLSQWPHLSHRLWPSTGVGVWDGATEWFRCAGFGFAVSIFVARSRAPVSLWGSAPLTAQALTTLEGQRLTRLQLQRLMINPLEGSHLKMSHNLHLILDGRPPLPNSLESWVENADTLRQQLADHLTQPDQLPASDQALQALQAPHAIMALNAERMTAILSWTECLSQQFTVICEPGLPTSEGPSQTAVQTKDTSKDKNTTTPLHSVQIVGLIQSQTPLGISAMRFVSDPDSWTFQSVKGPVHLVQYTTHVETPLGTAKSIVFRPNALQLLGQLPHSTALKKAWLFTVQTWRGAAVDPKSVLKPTDTQKQTTRRKSEQG